MCPYTEEAFPINGLLWGYFIGNLWIPVTRGQSCRAVMSPMLPARTSFHFWIGIGVVQVVQYCYLYWWLVYTIHRARIYDNWTDISLMLGLLSQFSRSVIFLIHQNEQNTCYMYDITLVFDRCRRSSAAATSDKYEHDWKYLTYTFVKSKFSCNGEISERSFSNPHPWRVLWPGNIWLRWWHPHPSFHMMWGSTHSRLLPWWRHQMETFSKGGLRGGAPGARFP